MLFVPRKLDSSRLPTKCNVMQHLIFLRSQNNPQFGFSKYFTIAAKDILDIYKVGKIPAKGRIAIIKQLTQLTKRYRNTAKNTSCYNEREWNTIFLVSSCTCPLNPRNPCRCPDDKEIPSDVWKFYVDQNGPRLLTLECDSERIPTTSDSVVVSEISSQNSTKTSVIFDPQHSEINEDNAGSLVCVEQDIQEVVPNISKICLPTFSAALDRAGVSNRFGALLATTLMKDLNFPGVIIDQHKIRRERNKSRAEALKAIKCNDFLKCLSFDGKRDLTLKQIQVNGKIRHIKMLEEHITMVKEPSSSYIGYLSSINGTGVEVAMEILNFLRINDFSLDHLVAVNCDGTRTNTGKNNGTVCSLERQLQRPLQWFVCLFHFNELPFTALLKSLLGKANGPHHWPGVIGKKLLGCEDIPVNTNYIILFFCINFLLLGCSQL